MRSPDAAWSLLEAGGPDEVTIRAVARAVNVSHAAPRHHFAGRSALIEAMIVEGFGWFVDALQAGWDSQEDPVAAFTEVGLAYVRFARTRPQVFQLITRPERHFPHGREDAIGEAAGRAFNVVLQGVEECQAVGSIDEGDPRMWAFVAWSGVHGLATMLDDGIAESVGIGVPTNSPSCCWRVWGKGSSRVVACPTSRGRSRASTGSGPELLQAHDPALGRRRPVVRTRNRHVVIPRAEAHRGHLAERPRAGDRQVGVSSQVEAVVQVDLPQPLHADSTSSARIVRAAEGVVAHIPIQWHQVANGGVPPIHRDVINVEDVVDGDWVAAAFVLEERGVAVDDRRSALRRHQGGTFQRRCRAIVGDPARCRIGPSLGDWARSVTGAPCLARQLPG